MRIRPIMAICLVFIGGMLVGGLAVLTFARGTFPLSIPTGQLAASSVVTPTKTELRTQLIRDFKKAPLEADANYRNNRTGGLAYSNLLALARSITLSSAEVKTSELYKVADDLIADSWYCPNGPLMTGIDDNLCGHDWEVFQKRIAALDERGLR